MEREWCNHIILTNQQEWTVDFYRRLMHFTVERKVLTSWTLCVNEYKHRDELRLIIDQKLMTICGKGNSVLNPHTKFDTTI